MSDYKVSFVQRVLPAAIRDYFARASLATDTSLTGVLSVTRQQLLYNTGFAGAVAGSPGTTATGYTDTIATGTLATAAIDLGLAATFTVSATRRYFSFAYAVTASTTYTYSYVITTVSGLTYAQIIQAQNNPAGSTITYKLNGAVVASGDTAAVGTLELILVVAGTTSTVNFRCGAGVAANATGSVTLHSPQLEIGSARTDYMYNTSTSATRHMPAYDGDDGIILEAARTNLLLQSQVLGTSWTANRTTVTTNAIAGPDGLTTAEKITEDGTAGATHRIYQSVAKAASPIQHTVSVYLKAGERTFAHLRMGENGETNQATVGINLSTGAVGSPYGNYTGMSARSDNAGNGWWRLQLTATSVSTTTITVYLMPAQNSTAATPVYDGDNASGIYAWGMQLEAGAFASSYIPTVASTVTRADANIGLTSLTPLGIAEQTNEYSVAIVVKMAFSSSSTDTASLTFCSIGYDSTNRIYVAYTAASQMRMLAQVAGNSIVLDATGQTWAVGDDVIMAFSKGATNGLIFRFKSTVVTDTGANGKAAFSGAITRLNLNNRSFASGFSYGSYKAIRIWDRALTQAELEAITVASLLGSPNRAPRLGIGYGIAI